MNEPDLEEAMRIINNPVIGWKVKRALLREQGWKEQSIRVLVPQESD